ncbi:MAG: glycosyltransferase family 2 protein [Candidatus Omnitrophota bacterium]
MKNIISKVSVVVPVFNEEDNIEVLYAQVKQACSQSNVDYEMIFVDDGSTDNSIEIIKRLKRGDVKVGYVSLSRNFGHQNAIFAGMMHCTGDAVITMDADLQHPPSIVPQMIDLWRKGTEVVYTTKKNANLPFIKYRIIKTAYWFISKISGLELHFGQSDFRLIDREVLNVILKMPEYHKFLRGQVRWVGFKQIGIPYTVEKRYSGKPKYSYKALYNLALDGIFSFGKYPLHLIMLLSLIIFSASVIYIFLVLLIWILKIFNIFPVPMPPGWTTLAMAVVFLGSIQLMTIGILSEYVGRIFDQTKNRPVFIAKETQRPAKKDELKYGG